MPHLSFHNFPSDLQLRAKWVRAIKRDEGPSFKIARTSTFVCAEHFHPEDLDGKKERTYLKRGAVPSRFPWNDWGMYDNS